MEVNAEPRKIEYYHPLFHRRLLADVIDFIVLALIALLSFVGFRAAFASSAEYKFHSERMDQNRASSGLYYSSDGIYSLLSNYYPSNSGTLSSQEVMTLYEKGLDTFLVYLGNEVGQEAQSTVAKDYDDFRLSLTHEEVHYFISVNGKVEKNSAASMSYQLYSDEVYRPYYADHAEGYFTVYAPHFIEDSKYFSTILLFIEIPCSVFIGAVLSLFVPPLFFKRGRQTLGKALYKIGRVDSQFLAVKLGRYCAESAILILAIVMLSCFTFGVPLLISFSLMAFSKKRQDFPDYMLGIEEIDLTDSKIFYSLEEAQITFVEHENRHVDFVADKKE
jgi:RDD family.